MAPDRFGAERPAARFLALAGVHRLERVDVAVGLVEVAVAVVVVAVPDVEPAQVGVDLRDRPARGDLRRVPGVHRVAQEQPDVRVGVVVVEGVVADPHPVGDVTVDGVPPGRLLDVEGAHRVRPGTLVEQQIQEVVAAEVGLPDRRVVHGAVGLRDVVVGEVLELAQHRPHRALAFPSQLDVLASRHLERAAARLAVQLRLERPRLERELPARERVWKIVAAPDAHGVITLGGRRLGRGVVRDADERDRRRQPQVPREPHCPPPASFALGYGVERTHHAWTDECGNEGIETEDGAGPVGPRGLPTAVPRTWSWKSCPR